MASLQKNVASQNLTFVLVNASTGAALTGATVSTSSKITIDNGAQGAVAGTFTEKGGGQYNYAPTQGETNGTDLGLLFFATSAIPVNIDIHTDPGVLLSAGTGSNQITLSSGQVTVGTNNDKTGYTASTVTDKTGYSLTSGERTSIADALLDRDMSVGADSGSPTNRTVRQALRFLRNKWAIVTGTLTVYKEDDATASWTATVATDGTALPIVSNDPAGP